MQTSMDAQLSLFPQQDFSNCKGQKQRTNRPNLQGPADDKAYVVRSIETILVVDDDDQLAPTTSKTSMAGARMPHAPVSRLKAILKPAPQVQAASTNSEVLTSTRAV